MYTLGNSNKRITVRYLHLLIHKTWTIHYSVTVEILDQRHDYSDKIVETNNQTTTTFFANNSIDLWLYPLP